MLQLVILIILSFGQQHIYVDQKAVDKNFALIDDFRKNQTVFQSDTFNLAGQSTDGGELIIYQNNERDYLVLDIWLFGETGKIHATYWTDKKNLHFKIIKRTDFKYDEPYYEKGYKVTETTEYLSYVDNSVRRYDAYKKELPDSGGKKKKESDDFFTLVTEDLKIVN